MQIRFAVVSWILGEKNDRAAERVVRKIQYNNLLFIILYDRLCGLLVRVSGYRYRGLGFDSRRYQIF